ncbi:MAG: tyrosine--tRNA ligase [bacterium]
MNNINTDSEKIKELLERGVEEICQKSNLLKKLKSGKQLRIKHGIDPTGPKIHLGRASQLWKLKTFQEMGHKVVLIIGDFTARIGDASDKQALRPVLSVEQIKANMKDYAKQIGKILDMDKVELHYNSEWLGKLSVAELMGLAMKFTAQQMIQRRNFKERWDQNKPIGLHELFYPLFQGYDSVIIKADVELGGFDQLFNLKVGREMQKIFNQEPQDIMALEMLSGLDGRKMSTSWGNVINIIDEAKEMYGKTMSMKDESMINYFKIVTQLPLKEIKKIEQGLLNKKLRPRDVKARLAAELVKLYYGEEEASKAAMEFENIFKEKKAPEQMPIFKPSRAELNIVDLLVEAKLASSKSDGRRLVSQKGVKINNKIQEDWKAKIILEKGTVVQVGKRKFIKID